MFGFSKNHTDIKKKWPCIEAQAEMNKVETVIVIRYFTLILHTFYNRKIIEAMHDFFLMGPYGERANYNKPTFHLK